MIRVSVRLAALACLALALAACPGAEEGNQEPVYNYDGDPAFKEDFGIIPHDPVPDLGLEGDGAIAPTADVAPEPNPAPDLGPAPGTWTIVSVQVQPATITAGGSVKVVTAVRAPAGESLTGGELVVNSKAPDGQSFTASSTSLSFAAGETKTITQQRGPYNMVGKWTYYASLKSNGKVLAGPTSGTSMTVQAAPSPSLPKNQTIKLTVPFTYQPDGYTCGTTSLRMVMAYYDKWVSVTTIGNYQKSIGDSPWSGGSEHWSLLAAAKHYGFPSTGEFTGWTTLKQKIAAKIPVLINLRSVINPNGGHYAVVTGLTFNSSSSVTQVFLNDPSGGKKAYSGSYFDSLWAFRNRWGMYLK